MYHNLKTLYDHTKKHYPELIKQFSTLQDYCTDNKLNNNTGFNSLKWIIFTLRDELSSSNIEDVFYFLLAELQNNEQLLYNNIKKTKTYFLNRELLKQK